MFEASNQLAAWQLVGAQLDERATVIQASRSALEAELCDVAAAAEQQDRPRAEGFTSTTAWLAAVTGLGRREAAQLVALSRLAPHECAATRDAWATGALTTSKAGIILRAIDTLPDWVDPEPRLDAEQILLDHASALTADDLRRVANRIIEVIDPDGADEIIGRQLVAEERKAWDATALRLIRSRDGLTKITGQLPNAQADMLATALEALASPRRASMLELESLGPYEQRVGRAFCELIEHLSTAALPQHGGVSATMTVAVDLDTLMKGIGTATLSTGEQISASQARRLACGAGIVPMVLKGDSQLLDVGREQRFHTRYQRIALAKTDGGCCWPGCDRPPDWCESHHLESWSSGGGTSTDNGALFCSTHHHKLHDDGWTARRSAIDGIVDVIPPASVDPDRRPRRHTRFTKLAPRAA